MKDYSELRRLGEAATKCYGAMRVEKDYNGVYLVVGAGSWKILSAWNTPDGKSKDNAEFHAAASPAAVLELIAELEIIKSNNADMILRNKVLRERPDLKPDRIACHSNVVSIQSDLLRLKQENESLKKDAARFRFIEQDASSGMSNIYGDEWVSVIDSIINEDNNK